MKLLNGLIKHNTTFAWSYHAMIQQSNCQQSKLITSTERLVYGDNKEKMAREETGRAEGEREVWIPIHTIMYSEKQLEKKLK